LIGVLFNFPMGFCHWKVHTLSIVLLSKTTHSLTTDYKLHQIHITGSCMCLHPENTPLVASNFVSTLLEPV